MLVTHFSAPVIAAWLAATITLLQVPESQRARVAWVPNPRAANGTWVADPAHHLSDAARETINSDIAALSAATGAELAVVIVDSTAGLEPFDFALALHRVWGVGKRDTDNGIVFLWVPARRAVWISIGQGLEGVLPDRRVGRIRDEEIFPAFRRGDFDAGMIAGVRALAEAARGEGSAASSRGGADDAPVGVWVMGGIGGGLATLIAGIALARRRRRRRPRPCPNGHGMMRRLDEQEDDAALEGGERLEESYHSVDYDVWLCDVCGHRLKLPYKAWFTSYEACPKCQRRTMKSRSRTIVAATTASTGLKRVTRDCGNCGHHDEREVTIPRVSTAAASSGSSGGGGGSFGGGSAGGGGAGGRY